MKEEKVKIGPGLCAFSLHPGFTARCFDLWSIPAHSDLNQNIAFSDATTVSSVFLDRTNFAVFVWDRGAFVFASSTWFQSVDPSSLLATTTLLKPFDGVLSDPLHGI